MKKNILNKIPSKNKKKLNKSIEKKQPFNKKSTKIKYIYKDFFSHVKFQDHIILKITIRLVNNIKIKDILFILKNKNKIKNLFLNKIELINK